MPDLLGRQRSRAAAGANNDRQQLIETAVDDAQQGISKFTAFIASSIVLIGLFGNFLYASLFDDIFPFLSIGIDFSQFRNTRDVIDFPRALFEKLKSSEQLETTMKSKLVDAVDILVIRLVVEVVSNIAAGFITYKYGHTCPIVFGCFSGLTATLGLIFSARMRWLLIVTTIIHAASSGFLVVGGLSLLVKFFERPTSRQRATTTIHLLSTIAYFLAPLSTVGMAFWSPWTVLVIVASLLFVAVLLFNLFFPQGQPFGGKLVSTRTYLKRAFFNARVVVTLICSFVVAFALSTLMAKSTSFLREMSDADRSDNKIALVVYGGFAVQLAFQLLAGVIFVQLVARPGISLIVSLFVAGLVFMTYPKVMEENYWLIVSVQFVARACLGVATIVIVPVLARLVTNQIRHKDGAVSIANNHGPIVGFYLAIYHLAFALGPICFYLLASVRNISVAYTMIGVMLIVASPLALVIVGRCLCSGDPRRLSFVTSDGTNSPPPSTNSPPPENGNAEEGSNSSNDDEDEAGNNETTGLIRRTTSSPWTWARI